MPGSRRLPVGSGHVLLLKGLLLLLGVGFAFAAAWRYGLAQRVWRADATGMSIGITVVFVAAQAHGSVCLLRLGRALHHMAAVERTLRRDVPGGGPQLPKGCVSRYFRDLHARASLGKGRPVDQGLLLESFEAELKQGHLFGGFIADLLLSLGLLGALTGLILMLRPIGELGLGVDALKGGLAAMDDGLALVALYTTSTGLLGGMLLKVQGFFLDGAADELVRRVARLTAVNVLAPVAGVREQAAVG